MKTKLLLLSLIILAGESMSAQLVLQICTAQLPCPGFPLGSVQAGVDQNGWRNFKVTLTQNVSLFSIVGTPPPSQASVNVIFTQDATGGRTVSFASNITNPCTIATGANATTLCQFEFDGIAGIWFGIAGGGAGLPAASASTQIPLSTGITPNSYAVVPLPTAPEGFVSWTLGSITAQTCVTNTILITGARANIDFVAPLWPAAMPASLDGLMHVSGADLVEARVCNPTAGTITLGSALTFGARIIR